MTELNSFIVLYGGKFIRAYHENEVDKVIAELTQKLNNEIEHRKRIAVMASELKKTQIAEYNDVMHQKYKRCLDNAKWCADVRELMHKLHVTDVDLDRRRMKACKWCRKWRDYWLELAKKFKKGCIKMDNVITKTIDNDGCEIIEVKFGNGNVGIGHGANSDTLKVQLFPMDRKYALGDEVDADEVKKAWDECKTLVELTFPTIESLENFIQVLDDYKHKHFTNGN